MWCGAATGWRADTDSETPILSPLSPCLPHEILDLEFSHRITDREINSVLKSSKGDYSEMHDVQLAQIH